MRNNQQLKKEQHTEVKITCDAAPYPLVLYLAIYLNFKAMPICPTRL
jgi:hypothetical protein